MVTCNVCQKNKTRLPDLPCGPCRKKASRASRVASSPSKKCRCSSLAVAAVTYLVLLSAPSCTTVAASANTAMRSSSSHYLPLGPKVVMGFNKEGDDNKIRILEEGEEEEEEESFINVGDALAAATGDGGDDVHSSHLFDDVHEDEDEDHDAHDHEDEENHVEIEHDDHDEDHDEHDEHNDHDDNDEEYDDHDEDGHDDHDEEHDEHDEEHDDHDDHGHDEHHDEFETASSHNDSQEDKPKPWGQVILATLLVNFASLSGLLLIFIPAIHRGYLKFQGSDPSGADGDKGRLFDVCVPAFAVGALMSTAFFLVMPEALHLIEGKHSDEGGGDDHSDHRFLEEDEHAGHDDHDTHSEEGADEHAGHDDSSESVTAAKFGVAVLAGFLLPMLFGMAFHNHGPAGSEDHAPVPAQDMDDGNDDMASRKVSVVTEGEGCDCCTKENPEDVETGVDVCEVKDSSDDHLPDTIVVAPASQAQDISLHAPQSEQAESLPSKTPIDYRLVAAVLVGDAFCNFVDGLFIGASFLTCSWATTLSILMITLFHELPQEMADFLLLTRYAGLSTMQACVVNFGSGLIVTLGGLAVFVGNTSDEAVGVILAMAGGCYINIAACETVPRMERHLHSFGDRAAMVFSFIVGTVPIGLVLLKHEHC